VIQSLATCLVFRVHYKAR